MTNKTTGYDIKAYLSCLLVVDWGLRKNLKKAFRPAMALSSGELSSLSGKLLLMTATATKKTMRVLQEQFPEVSKWNLLLHLPLRKNVTTLVPPPHQIPSNFEATLAPFIKRMKEYKETYLIIVRGKVLKHLFSSLLNHRYICPCQLVPSTCLAYFQGMFQLTETLITFLVGLY